MNPTTSTATATTTSTSTTSGLISRKPQNSLISETTSQFLAKLGIKNQNAEENMVKAGYESASNLMEAPPSAEDLNRYGFNDFQRNKILQEFKPRTQTQAPSQQDFTQYLLSRNIINVQIIEEFQASQIKRPAPLPTWKETINLKKKKKTKDETTLLTVPDDEEFFSAHNHLLKQTP